MSFLCLQKSCRDRSPTRNLIRHFPFQWLLRLSLRTANRPEPRFSFAQDALALGLSRNYREYNLTTTDRIINGLGWAFILLFPKKERDWKAGRLEGCQLSNYERCSKPKSVGPHCNLIAKVQSTIELHNEYFCLASSYHIHAQRFLMEILEDGKWRHQFVRTLEY